MPPPRNSKKQHNFSRVPAWALEVMVACARGAHRDALVTELEEALDAHLFSDTQDSLWYGDFPTFTRAQSREIPPPSSWKSVDPSTIDVIFGEGGDLAQRFDRYEPRAGQVAMAHAVTSALNKQQFLLAEAGTGVGKSLAYLVPCALWSVLNHLPIVVSTNTRNLQSQLLDKDLPLVQRIVARHLPQGRALNAVVLKGRNNYLCLKHFGAYLEGGFENLTENESLLFADLVAWAARTASGDFDTFRPTFSRGDMAFVHSFGCKGDTCTGKKCRFYKRCFLQKARQDAIGADVVIANHALVFAELENPGALLPPHAQVVFDEAHNIESAATTFLTDELSPIALYDLCQKVAPSRGREAGSLYHQARVDFIDKAITVDSEREIAVDLLARLRKHGATLAKAGTDLFEELHILLERTPDDTVRYRRVPDETKPALSTGHPQMRREVCLSGKNFLPAEDFLPEGVIQKARDAVHDELQSVVECLEQLLALIERKTSSVPEPYEDLVAAIEAARDGFDALAEQLDRLLDGEASDRVYWLERSSPKESSAKLCAAPLDIALQLKRCLYELKQSVLFSSATLRIAEDFAHIRRRLGLNLIDDQARVVDFVAESPFNYPEQCSVIVPDFLPEVETRAADYTLELSRLMYQLFTTAQGRSLALFTSYEMMRNCAEILEPHLKDKGIELLVQSAGQGREAMTEAFRAQDKPTVLFGTQSFWEGVDVVGDALSCVVIARLPFESINDPILKARGEQIERNGGNSFLELSLPQALIRFRQGFGRLIRSRSDRGIVVVADNRIVRKSYGTTFAKTLPVNIAVGKSRGSVVQRLRVLLEAKKSCN